MAELREILAAFADLRCHGEAGVLASVVHVEGSTYRRPGARMLVLPDDRMVSLLSGGCLEGDLLEHARAVRASGQPRLVHYDSRAEDDIVWGLGLGCAGVVEVWLERVDDARPGPLVWLQAWRRERAAGAIATQLEAPGERRALHADGRLEGSLQDADDALLEAYARRHSSRQGPLAVEFVPAPLHLALFGGGPDAVPVARLAAELGFAVTVLEGRPAYARPERFPLARVALVEPEASVAAAALGPESFAVVMTHHYLHDRTILRGLLESPDPVRYIGLLGPQRRSEELLRDLAADGLAPDDANRARIHAPAGLDIGGDGPQGIALAILAEIQALAAGRSGGWLRERKGPIHDPEP